MKYIKFFLGFLLFTGNVYLIAGPGPNTSPMHREVIQEYKNLKLLSVLDLNEEESEKVLPILNAMDKEREELFEKQRDLIGKIEKKLKENASDRELSKLNKEYLNLLINHVQQRKKHMEKLQVHLPPEKFSRFLVFERQFGERLRKRIEEMHRQHKY